MDATIKGKIDFLGKQAKMLANSANDAANHYNYIIQTHFDSKFWQKAGLAGSSSALLVETALPKVTISAIPDMIATSSAATGTLALPATTSTALATSSSVAGAGGAIFDGSLLAGDVLAAGAAEAMPGITYASGTAAAGGTAVGGGAAASMVLPVIIAGIAAAVAGKAIGETVGNIIMYKQGKQQLQELSDNVAKLKSYCKSMESQISASLSDLRNASSCISKAESKIAKQQYPTKDKNIKKIRERQAEVVGMMKSLSAIKSVIAGVYANLSQIA